MNFTLRGIDLAIILTLIVIVLGAYTRLTDAGLGCPDWPGCYGHLIVPDSIDEQAFSRPLEPAKAWAEMIHRYAAGGLGVLLLVLFIAAIFSRHLVKGSSKVLALLIVTIVFQILLGMWTVTLKVNPVVVTAHLLGGFTTLSLIWWLKLMNSADRASPHYRYKGMKVIKAFAFTTLIATIIQITLGGWTSTNYAALSCGTSFPTCQEQWWPEMDFASGFALELDPDKDYEFGVLDSPARTAIQVVHRIGALVVTLMGLILGLWLFIARIPAMGMLPLLLLFVLAIQVSLGISNVVFALPLLVATGHNLFGALFLVLLLAANYKLYADRSEGGL